MENENNVSSQKGIGLHKISYEMDVANSKRDQSYVAGVIAYDQKEAIDTLIAFARKRVKGFKGMKINEVAFEGGCHAISDPVRSAVLKVAIDEGLVISKEKHEEALALNTKKEVKKTVKKSILPKGE